MARSSRGQRCLYHDTSYDTGSGPDAMPRVVQLQPMVAARSGVLVEKLFE